MTPPADSDAALGHIVVVGGTEAEWRAMGEEVWRLRLDELGKVADHAGVHWLTLRPYGPDRRQDGAGQDGEIADRRLLLGTCTVVASAGADGRQRLVAAIRAVSGGGATVSEGSLAEWINRPADCDPDLILVLGTSDRLPPSLVWELAYGELIYVDVTWAELRASHLEEAVNAFAARHRRFGGLDS